MDLNEQGLVLNLRVILNRWVMKKYVFESTFWYKFLWFPIWT